MTSTTKKMRPNGRGAALGVSIIKETDDEIGIPHRVEAEDKFLTGYGTSVQEKCLELFLR